MQENKISDLKNKIGKNIKIYRIKKDYSQEELAYKANIHTTHLSKIENGHSNFTIEILYKIADGLEIEINDLLNDYKYDK